MSVNSDVRFMFFFFTSRLGLQGYSIGIHCHQGITLGHGGVSAERRGCFREINIVSAGRRGCNRERNGVSAAGRRPRGGFREKKGCLVSTGRRGGFGERDEVSAERKGCGVCCREEGEVFEKMKGCLLGDGDVLEK